VAELLVEAHVLPLLSVGLPNKVGEVGIGRSVQLHLLLA